jgi:hypothetical protein
MEPSEVLLLRRGFGRKAPRAEDVGLGFYERLVELDPSVRSPVQQGSVDGIECSGNGIPPARLCSRHVGHFTGSTGVPAQTTISVLRSS